MKRHVIVICFLAICFWFTPGVNSAELRTWIYKSGKFTVKAELLSFDQGVVSLRRKNGKTIKVPLAKLSKEDQEYVLAEPKPKADSVAALKKQGARIKQSEQGEILELYFTGTQVTDAGLVHLKGLTKLELLRLSDTQITDAGLVRLKGLTKMEELSLYGTHVTDTGLVHLKGLTSLMQLYLTGTRITDAGLVHLKGLTKLEELYLGGTKVTGAGVAELKKALPKCRISR